MLKERQLNVLSLVVQLFTETGQPVGSATLKNLGVNASSATIRNDLALLEDLGFLEKTHVSSGRIPSTKGYRYYVDNLLVPKPLEGTEELSLQRSFGDGFFEMDDLFEKSVSILSKMTDMTTFILGPSHNNRILTEFHLIRVSKTKGMAVVVTSGGNVESRMFPISEQLTDEVFDQMMQIASERFVGESLDTIYQRLRTELPITLQRYFGNSSMIINLFEVILDHVFEDKVYVSGQMNLLDAASGEDLDEFKKLFNLLSNDEELVSIVPNMEHNIEVKIGSEINNDLLQNMTLITAKYNVTNADSGVIALIGPQTMSYDETIGIVESFQTEMQNQLRQYYRLLNDSKF